MTEEEAAIEPSGTEATGVPDKPEEEASNENKLQDSDADVVAVQPTSVTIEIEPSPAPEDDQETDWQIGLLDACRNTKSGAIGICCPLCLVNSASTRLGESWLYPCIFGPLGLSARFRTQHHIRMTLFEEGCSWLFCYHCMACRLINEMDYRQISKKG